MPTDISKLIEQTKNRRLKQHTTAQRTKVQAMGGSPKKGGPSILSRVFDVISRPLYGVSEGIARASEHVGSKNPRKGKNAGGDILAGIVGGLAGKNKTYMGDALLRAAEADPDSLLSKPLRENKGNLRTIAGFVGDVALDPLTYTGVGVARSAGKSAVKAAGVQATNKALHTADVAKRIETAANTAKVSRAESIATRVAAGRKGPVDAGKAVEKAGIDAAKRTEREIFQELQSTVGKQAEDAVKAANPGKIGLKFAGKTVAESEKAYRGLAKVGEIVGKTEPAQKLSEAFRTSHLFPETTNSLRRRVTLKGIAHAEDDVKQMRKMFADLTTEEKIMISHAIEAGPVKQIILKTADDIPTGLAATGIPSRIEAIDDSINFVNNQLKAGKLTPEQAQQQLTSLEKKRIAASKVKPKSGTPVEEVVKSSSLHGVTAKNGRDLGEYVDEAKRIFRTFGEDEAHKQIFRPIKGKKGEILKKPEDHLIDNYVYHVYEGGTEAERRAMKLARKIPGPETPGFTKQRHVPTLAEAKAKGLKPVEAIDDIIAKRTGKHYAAVARSEYVNAIKKEYGQKITNRGVRAQLKKEGWRQGSEVSKYIDSDVMLPEPIAKSLSELEKMYDNDELAAYFMRAFDKIQGRWKFYATAANPGHHIRNMMGDVWNNWLDGVVDPRHYDNAAKILMGNEKVKVKVGNQVLDNTEIMRLFNTSGSRPGFTTAELAANDPGLLKNKFRRGMTNVAEKREEYTRMAHFIHAIKDEAKKGLSIEDAANKAGERLRKWNLDYADVTDFERKYLKRAIPFYTWTRKNIPLQIEALAMRPGRVSMIPKGNAAIEQLLGTYEGPNRTDFTDTVPKWLKEMAPIRLRGEGEGKNSLYWVPALPFQDISKYAEGGTQGVFQNVMSQITPIGRVPFEIATGKQVFSGSNVPGLPEYAAGQLPVGRQAFNLLTGKQKPLSAKTLNWLTGAGVHEVTPQAVAGELRRQEDPLQAQIRAMRDKARKKAMGE